MEVQNIKQILKNGAALVVERGMQTLCQPLTLLYGSQLEPVVSEGLVFCDLAF